MFRRMESIGRLYKLRTRPFLMHKIPGIGIAIDSPRCCPHRLSVPEEVGYQPPVNAPVNTLSSTHRQRPRQHSLVNAPPTSILSHQRTTNAPSTHHADITDRPPTHKDCKKIKVQLELYIQKYNSCQYPFSYIPVHVEPN
jgi:hypothetical protein